jgi:anti-sigma regulatory factor (Ser/Thr protein kinase)
MQERQAGPVRICGGRGAPNAARVAVRSLLAGRVSPDRLADAALAVTELVANSVRHAGAGPAEDIGVDVLLVADRIRLCVTDSGSTQTPRLVAREPDEPGGLGLVVVDGLAAAWGVARDGTGITRTWCDLPSGDDPRRSRSARSDKTATPGGNALRRGSTDALANAHRELRGEGPTVVVKTSRAMECARVCAPTFSPPASTEVSSARSADGRCRFPMT